MTLKRLIAWAVFDERHNQGLSQEELAKKAKVHRTIIGKIEYGGSYTLTTAESVLDALGVNRFVQLVKDDPERQEASDG